MHQTYQENITSQSVTLPGTLTLPASPKGIVIFAHGSGSSRMSPRNMKVAANLNDAGIGTLLFDLLTPKESENRKNVFDIPLLASRLILATHWLKAQRLLEEDTPIGYFGASTGAGAALWAAGELGSEVKAVVSRGGRPDLATPKLLDVTAPTLLLVGEKDPSVIVMNELALQLLKQGKLVIVPAATHLFEEPGALAEVERHARNWFLTCFQAARSKSDQMIA